MRNKRTILLAALAVALLLTFVWWSNYPAPQTPSALVGQTHSTASAVPSSTTQTLPAQTPSTPLTYEVPARGTKYQGMSDPRWKWWTEMEKRDSSFEWKMPITFWGKVIDQNNQPVPDVNIRFGWNGMNGSNERFGSTDGQGLFSITGIQGKILSVKVQKEGYHTSGSPAGRGFEYAAFFEPHYHEPDANNPVVFQLLKKQPAEPLVRTEQEVKLSQIGSVAIVKMDASTTVEIKLLANEIKRDQPWSVQVTADGGGLQATTDEFPVEAPTDGYQTSMTLDKKSPRPPNWSGLHQGGIFYVKTANGYGRLELRMITGKDWARVTTYVNPTGSRNLESGSKSP